jgi:hypothetical protein
MNKTQLEMQIQQQTQKDVANLKKDVLQLIKAFEYIDENARNSYSSLVSELAKLGLRVNFLINFIKEKFNAEENDKMFKEYSEVEQARMKTEIEEIMKKKAEEEAAKEAEGKVIQ